MSGSKAKSSTQTSASPETASSSVLNQVISATKQTEPDRAADLVRALVEQASAGVVKFDRNLNQTIERAITQIDKKLSEQLNAIMHDERFLKLEGSWRGLHYFVHNTETSANLKLRMLNVSKRELNRDLTRATEFDQSVLFRKIYESEFGTPGGEPYGALVGDYEWTNHPDDIETLRQVSSVGAAAFAPFVSGVSPAMFGFDDWSELSKPRDLEKIFDGVEYQKWRGFRDSEDSRFVSLVMPRVMARLPYGNATRPVGEFDYEEAPLDENGRPTAMQHDKYCWMNAAFVMGARLTDSFARTGFCTTIRGAEGGGKVDNLPTYTFMSDDGDADTKCPTEIGITDRREHELSKLGFLPLCHYKNHDHAVFFGAQTAHKAKEYDRPEATANAKISSRLPYIMATGRFAHYLKVMARDKIGSFAEAEDCESWLNRWIGNYVNTKDNPGPENKARYPLRDARIEVREIPGSPGAYNAVAYLRPWLQMEELTTSMRLVARVPKKS
ncbi:type VI secretion system contractile sheath large subunit [Acetobacter sp.]|jgi:type VI secretion system protein ImpC|uniref:type VI secretion system contractile sheath large subunit n=1 Tax=Acetobacter sp. TaxID=440 RepID=UPI0025B873F4|nr:type VI secretion system contractile sheath large subunit [Acetobacter sp.]MCH4092636.1 type VI secretion system contractile sheath large subunit [Acetobacter sp.]MCI1299770.1 type VI secretion system contractile sheath large subunit [Acetobacter sp.]MCI1315350.1 type VI secretion system contractile sheath large subunit [Acetobacter sp.]